jgi:hypothetical protein
MTISFPVREAVAYPDRFTRSGCRLAFYGLLMMTADEAILQDWQTDDRLQLDPVGTWRTWLLQDIPPLTGEYIYFDEATVCGWLRIDADRIVLDRIWEIIVLRDGNYLVSADRLD